MNDAAIVSHHKGPVYGQRCGSCGQYWPCDTEVTIRTEFEINDLFDAGGPDGSPLPFACHEAGPWQAPGTVAVRVEALRALAKAAGIAT